MKKIICYMFMMICMVTSTGVFASVEEVFVEENQVVTTCEGQTYTATPTKIEGKAMLPLRHVLEQLGYEITWQASTNSVDIKKGAQWTSITLNKNAYFKNRMAAFELSIGPVLEEDTTFVPLEFFTEVLDLNVSVNKGQVTIEKGRPSIMLGTIKDMIITDGKIESLTLTSDITSEAIDSLTIIHLSGVDTFVQTELEIGKEITVVTSPMMTMSLPAQTAGYLIY